MKKVLDIIGDIILFIIIISTIICGFFVIGNYKFIPIFVLTVSPIILFFYARKYKDTLTIKMAQKLHNLCCGVGFLFGVLMFFSYDRYEVYIAKKLINGTAHSEESVTENSDGEDVSRTKYGFKVANEEDSYKVTLILFWVLVMAVGSPYYIINRSDRLIDEVREIHNKRLEES